MSQHKKKYEQLRCILIAEGKERKAIWALLTAVLITHLQQLRLLLNNMSPLSAHAVKIHAGQVKANSD